MPVEDILHDLYLYKLKQPKVIWEGRVPLNVTEATREKISRYFTESPNNNTPSIFVSYQLDPPARELLDKVLNRHPIYTDVVYPEKKDKIKIISWGRKEENKITTLKDYLKRAESVSLTFMFGTHLVENCLIEWNLNSSRIGRIKEN